jgi:hypothetical protein
MKHKIYEAIKTGFYTFYDGSKQCLRDWKYFRNVRKTKGTKIETFSFEEIMRMKTIKKDFNKLIPFWIVIALPFSSVLMPAYLLTFPNAMPSYYTPRSMRLDKMRKLEEDQAASREALLKIYEKILGVEQAKDSLLKIFHEREMEILSKLSLEKLNSDELILVCRYLTMEYYTGTHLLSLMLRIPMNLPFYIINFFIAVIFRSKNRIAHDYWPFNIRLKLNYFPFEGYKRNLIIKQIQQHLHNNILEDIAVVQQGQKEQIFQQRSLAVVDFARERGIISYEKTFLQTGLEQYWFWELYEERIQSSDEKLSLYFWLNVLNYKKDQRVFRPYEENIENKGNTFYHNENTFIENSYVVDDGEFVDKD